MTPTPTPTPPPIAAAAVTTTADADADADADGAADTDTAASTTADTKTAADGGCDDAGSAASGRPGSRYGQNGSQRLHFEHLGCLAPDIARMSFRGLILSIWAPWRQIWPERASEASF